MMITFGSRYKFLFFVSPKCLFSGKQQAWVFVLLQSFVWQTVEAIDARRLNGSPSQEDLASAGVTL